MYCGKSFQKLLIGDGMWFEEAVVPDNLAFDLSSIAGSINNEVFVNRYSLRLRIFHQ